MYRGVATHWFPRYQRVATCGNLGNRRVMTPRCPKYQGVATPWFPKYLPGSHFKSAIKGTVRELCDVRAWGDKFQSFTLPVIARS